ncbi:hypothetical protein VNI00_006683 [Paramarasmius palmivorus]|uniref:Oxidoreductase AflY n=1 Tax=Paramarasmius palmivorus TaxID=297713 RepID=A0AAW0DB03_9AGAR
MSTKTNNSTQTKFVDLWPVPSAPPFASSPTRVAGVNPESTQKLRDLLKLNHDNWHIFYDAVGRHDHMAHHLLALWSLGADAKVLQDAYDVHVPLQSPVGGEQAERITKENVFDHLGDRTYYKAYLVFFSEVVREKGGVAAVEEYVFSDWANFGSKNVHGKHPEMLSRFIGGLLHSVIHVGYGVEFGLPGMFVEGLAQAAVTDDNSATVVPESLFTVDGTNKSPGKEKNVHALTILGRALKDNRLEVRRTGTVGTYTAPSAACGAASVDHAGDWLLDMQPSPELVQRKIQELEWAITIMCVLAGYEEGKEYNADFIAMHFVTSSLFLGSLVPSLTPRSQALLLRAYFSLILAVWAMLGKPEPDFGNFFGAPLEFEGPHYIPAPTKFVLAPSTNPNPWLEILQQAIVHPDDHLAKFQRAMYHYAVKYGSVHAGYFANTELAGSEKIDGSLFVRGAALAAQRIGREVEELPHAPHMTFWDRRSFQRDVTEEIY